jgi:hypothetical protein
MRNGSDGRKIHPMLDVSCIYYGMRCRPGDSHHVIHSPGQIGTVTCPHSKEEALLHPPHYQYITHVVHHKTHPFCLLGRSNLQGTASRVDFSPLSKSTTSKASRTSSSLINPAFSRTLSLTIFSGSVSATRVSFWNSPVHSLAAFSSFFFPLRASFSQHSKSKKRKI